MPSVALALARWRADQHRLRHAPRCYAQRAYRMIMIIALPGSIARLARRALLHCTAHAHALHAASHAHTPRHTISLPAVATPAACTAPHLSPRTHAFLHAYRTPHITHRAHRHCLPPHTHLPPHATTPPHTATTACRCTPPTRLPLHTTPATPHTSRTAHHTVHRMDRTHFTSHRCRAHAPRISSAATRGQRARCAHNAPPCASAAHLCARACRICLAPRLRASLLRRAAWR